MTLTILDAQWYTLARLRAYKQSKCINAEGSNVSLILSVTACNSDFKTRCAVFMIAMYYCIFNSQDCSALCEFKACAQRTSLRAIPTFTEALVLKHLLQSLVSQVGFTFIRHGKYYSRSI